MLRYYLGRRYSGEICSLAKELKLSPFETALERSIDDPDIENGMNLLIEDLREVQLHRNEKPQTVAEIAWAIVEKRGFNIDTRETKGLFRLMARYRNLGEITQQIEKLRHLSNFPRERRIHLSTIHRAKGLEHRAVVLLGCVEGVLPLEIRGRSQYPGRAPACVCRTDPSKGSLHRHLSKYSLRRTNRTLPVHSRNGAQGMRVGEKTFIEDEFRSLS